MELGLRKSDHCVRLDFRGRSAVGVGRRYGVCPTTMGVVGGSFLEVVLRMYFRRVVTLERMSRCWFIVCRSWYSSSMRSR